MEPPQKIKTVANLSTHSPIEILRLVFSSLDNFHKGHKRELPRVTIYMNGGSFSGFVIGIKEEPDASYIMMVEHDDTVRGQGINAIYLPLWAVVAVKVHDCEQFLPLLSGGKTEVVKQATPGIVGLQKKIADEILHIRTVLQTNIKMEVSWETLAQDDLTLLGLYELIESFMLVVHEKISDEFKRIAFKTLVTVIRFQNAQEAEIFFDDQILIVRADLKARQHGRFTQEEFSEALDKVIDPQS